MVVPDNTEHSPESCLESVSRACLPEAKSKATSLSGEVESTAELGTAGFHGNACTLQAWKLGALGVWENVERGSVPASEGPTPPRRLSAQSSGAGRGGSRGPS